MATRFENPADLLDAVGKHLGFSDWEAVDQQRIDQFANATGDHQWIHVDPEKAADGMTNPNSRLEAVEAFAVGWEALPSGFFRWA